MSDRGDCKVADFGLARVVASVGGDKVEMTAETGTYRWMAPEARPIPETPRLSPSAAHPLVRNGAPSSPTLAPHTLRSSRQLSSSVAPPHPAGDQPQAVQPQSRRLLVRHRPLRDGRWRAAVPGVPGRPGRSRRVQERPPPHAPRGRGPPHHRHHEALLVGEPRRPPRVHGGHAGARGAAARLRGSRARARSPIRSVWLASLTVHPRRLSARHTARTRRSSSRLTFCPRPPPSSRSLSCMLLPHRNWRATCPGRLPAGRPAGDSRAGLGAFSRDWSVTRNRRRVPWGSETGRGFGAGSVKWSPPPPAFPLSTKIVGVGVAPRCQIFVLALVARFTVRKKIFGACALLHHQGKIFACCFSLILLSITWIFTR